MRASVLAGIALAAIIASAPVNAADDPALLGFSVGQFDEQVLDLASNDTDDAVDFRLEYRFGTSLIPATESIGKLKPWVGVEGTSDGAIYGLGGILFDMRLGSFVVTPSFGVGLYHEGDGKDLGHPIEFRSQLELGYEFENAMRVTTAFSHISNAGLDDRNPGANIIGIYFHTPVGSLFGN